MDSRPLDSENTGNKNKRHHDASNKSNGDEYLYNGSNVPNNPDDVVLHYERTRRIMIAKALLGMFKSGALNTIMLKKKLFQYKTSAD